MTTSRIQFRGRWIGLTTAIVCAASVATGAEPQPGESPVVKFALHPAAETIPAMKYHLLPQYDELAPGNAAPLYCKVALIANNNKPTAWWQKIDRWQRCPLADLSREDIEEAEAALRPFSTALEYLTIAARRNRCDWDMPIREVKVKWAIPLPEFQELRKLAQLLALKARLQMAAGKTDEALSTIATGLAMSRHIAECPFLVCGLIGQATAAVMIEQLETLSQLENAPNLYWSLTALPDPLIDFRPALEVEGDVTHDDLLGLKDVERLRRSPAEWQEQLAALLKRIDELRRAAGTENETAAPDNSRSDAAARLNAALKSAPHAKAGLIAAGRDADAVEAMPDAQAVLAFTALSWSRRRDDLFKWFYLPGWQSQAGMHQAALAAKGPPGPDEEIVPLAKMLLPALEAVQAAVVRNQRRIAALRTIEAVRLYAAEHEGKLPATLEDIKQVPTPIDPVTGKPFVYSFAEGKASFEGEPALGDSRHVALRYELTIAPAGNVAPAEK